MILAATTVCSVHPVSQSAILGYHQSALVCILVCLIKFQGQDEKGPPNRSCGAVPGKWCHRALDDEPLVSFQASHDRTGTTALGGRGACTPGAFFYFRRQLLANAAIAASRVGS